MHDVEKSKSQLIEELSALRKRLADLEGKHRHAPLNQDVRTTADFSLVRQEGRPAAGSHRAPTDGLSCLLLQALFDHLPEFIYAKDCQGRFILANKSLCEHLGLADPGEIVGKTDFDLFPREVAEAYQTEELDILRTGKSIINREQFSDRGPDGPTWMVVSKMPLRDPSTGAIVGLVGVNRDLTELKKTQQSLAASQQLYRSTLDTIADAIHVVTPDLRIVLANQTAREWARRVGISPDMEGLPLRQAVPFLSDTVFDEYRRIFEEGEATVNEDRFTFAGGDMYTETRRIPMKDGDKVTRVVTVVRDITARRQIEAALSESRARIQQMVDSVPIVLYSAEAGTNRTLLMQGAIKRLFGYDAEDFFRDPDFGRQIEHPEDADRLHRAYMAGLASMRPFDLTYRIIHGTTGQIRWLNQFVVPVADDQGRLLRQDCVILDITDLKCAEERLELLSTAVEQSTEGVAVADLDGRVVFLNDAFARMHGYAVSEVLGKHLSAFHLPNQMPSVDLAMARILSEGQFSGEIWHARKDGTPFLGLMHCTLLRDSGGNPAALVAMLRDITAWKEAEQRSTRLAQAVANAGEGIAIWDADWALTYANQALAAIFGAQSPDDLTDLNWPRLLNLRKPRQKATGPEELGSKGAWEGRLSANRLDGRKISLAVTLSRLPLEDGKFLTVGNIRDMTQEESYVSQIRRLGQDTDRLLEEERDRISKELHDELGQLLTAMNIGLAGLASCLGGANRDITERLAELRDLLDRTLASVRGLARSLRPGALDYRSIQDSLRSLIDDARKAKNITYSLRLRPPDLEVPKPLRRVLFRIAQEALTNIVRHSNATACSVALRRILGGVALRIRDNGTIVDRRALDGQSSLGIIGMHERAAAAGGRLRVRRPAEGGVCVTAQFPSSVWVEGQHDQNTYRG